MGDFLLELKRRHIYRVAAAYLVVAWVLLQVFNNLEPILKLPDWSGTLILVLLFGGFPVAVLLAWIVEAAPHNAGQGNSAPASPTSKPDWIVAGALVLVAAIFAYQQIAPSHGTSGAQQASLATAASPAQPGAISIAVLPLANLSGDAAQEFFSDGMTDEITSALAKVRNLSVVGRSSAFQFKGQNKDLRAIGNALSARYLIDGSVRKAGDRVRITAQLVQADNGVQLWSENYDRELKDVFAVQEDIAQAIAGALKVPLGLQQGESLVSNRTGDLDSYQQYLAARSLVRARGTGLEQAVAILEPVVARDPSYAPAWALLADAYRLAPYFTPVMRSDSLEESHRGLQEALEKAEMAARRALMLDPKNGAGYAKLAVIETERGHWAAGEDLYRKALEFDPNDPDTLHIYSVDLAIEGRLKDALAMRERLRTLEPFVPIYNIFSGTILQVNGQTTSAIALLEKVPSDAAGGYYPNRSLALAYAGAGRYKEAADTLLFISGNLVSRKSVEDAARLLRQAPAKVSAPDALPPLNSEMNFVYGYIGALDRVIEFPERTMGYAQNSATFVLWLPEYAPLRKTERFKAYMRKSGLVDYWRARGWPDLCHPTTGDDFECS